MSNSPCAACKCLRRKCTQECPFAPYFPPDQPQRFSSVHKVFGASNVAKLLNDLSPPQREDAVNSLAYEAEARLRDPVYGCVGLISILQHRLKQLQGDLYAAKKELATYIGPTAMMPLYQPNYHPSNPATTFGFLQYSMNPMAAGPSQGGHGPTPVPAVGGQLLIREAQPQPQPQPHPQPQQLIEAQQMVAIASREDLEMMRNWEQQCQQQLQPQPQSQPQAEQFFRFNGGGNSAYETTTLMGDGGGFNQLAGTSGVGSPSLALAGSSFDQNAYHNPMQQDDSQEPLLLLQQPESTLQQQETEEEGVVVAHAIPLQLQAQPQLQPSVSHSRHQLQLFHRTQHQPGSDEGTSTVGPSC